MSDLRTTCYSGRAISNGEIFNIARCEPYDHTIPICIAVALRDISPEEIDQAQRLSDLNNTSIADVLMQGGAIEAHPANELLWNMDNLEVDFNENKMDLSKRTT